MNDFQLEDFLSKANGMVKRVLGAITLGRLDEVHYFLSEELYQKLKDEYIQNEQQGRKAVYSEVNVNCKVLHAKEEDGYTIVSVSCLCKYLKYYISLDNGKIIEGDSKDRVSVVKTITFQKRKDAVLPKMIRCAGCGRSLNLLESGECPNCGREYRLDDYDYIMKDMS